MKKFTYLVSLFTLLFVSLQVFSQSTVVRGIVMDESSIPLEGASVIVSGTSQGTLTNSQGQFMMRVGESFPLSLQISFVGYDTQSIEVSTSEIYTVQLFARRFDEVIVSASRRAEKLQEAPAAVSVISASQLTLSGGSISPLRALTNSPGVELQQQTGQRMNVALRGSSGIFSTNVFPMLDYRSLISPGLEFFDSQNSPLQTIDLERIEVVLGPGSALYGPDVTTGVIHFISKDPFKYPGTTVELVYGERDIFKVALRQAGHNKNETFGYKFNFKYGGGRDFTLDPNDSEDQKILNTFKTSINRAAISSQGNVDTSLPGTLLFNTTQTQQEKYWSGLANTSLFFRPVDGMEIVTAGGWNAGSAIFYNDLGEGQAFGDEYWVQSRFNYDGWFAQTYYITNSGGSDDNPTYLNRTGLIVPLERSHFETQLQYNFSLEQFLQSEWTVGIDYRKATANTENHVYGRNENDDNYKILGGYGQGKFKLDSKLDLYLAGRLDGYNFVDDKTFSPRAALVYKPNEKNNIRFTYNRAANPIPASDIYFDLPIQSLGVFDVWILGAKEPYEFGQSPHINWLIPGVPNTLYADGFPLAAAFQAVNQQVISGFSVLENDPALAPLLPVIQQVLNNPAITPLGYTSVVSTDVEGQLLEPQIGVKQLISFLTSYELGYKGTIGNQFSFGFDFYHYRRKGGVSFQQITPVVSILNLPDNLGKDVRSNAQPAIEQALLGIGLSQEEAVATAELLGVQIQGAYSSAGEVFIQQLTDAGLPFHGIIPLVNNLDEDTPRVTLGYFTTDPNEISTDFGAEAHFKYFIRDDFMVQGNYTWFKRDEGNPGDLSFPEHKVRMGFFFTPKSDFSAALNYQWDQGYTSNNPNFPGSIPAKNLIDLNLGYDFSEGLHFEISAINLLNNQFRSLPGFPRIGRTVSARLVFEIN